jgi:hypothetical protein
MNKQNPFPGMNPWLEEHWPGVHSRLITYLADALANTLPEDLSALPEEGVSISAESHAEHHFRADVAVTESWKVGVPPTWVPGADLEARAAVPTICWITSSFQRSRSMRWINSG